MIKISLKLLIFSILVFFLSCENESDEKSNGNSTAVFNPNVEYGTLIDVEGNVYKTVTINNKVWMAENLRTKSLNDGTSLRVISDPTEWLNVNSSACCNYNNTTDNTHIATYGRLYNGYSVETDKLAPKGWHVATDKDWFDLIAYVGNWNIAAIKLKETDSFHWIKDNTLSDNATGLTLLPGGGRYELSKFYGLGEEAEFWTSTQAENIDHLYSWLVENSYTRASNCHKGLGLSVRCVKNE